MPEIEIQHLSHNTQLWQIWEQVPHPQFRAIANGQGSAYHLEPQLSAL